MMNLMKVIAMLLLLPRGRRRKSTSYRKCPTQSRDEKYFEDPTITIFNILHHLHVINKEIGLTEIDDVLSLGDVLILTLPKVKVT